MIIMMVRMMMMVNDNYDGTYDDDGE